MLTRPLAAGATGPTVEKICPIPVASTTVVGSVTRAVWTQQLTRKCRKLNDLSGGNTK